MTENPRTPPDLARRMKEERDCWALNTAGEPRVRCIPKIANVLQPRPSSTKMLAKIQQEAAPS
jgi:hypothetical protein